MLEYTTRDFNLHSKPYTLQYIGSSFYFPAPSVVWLQHLRLTLSSLNRLVRVKVIKVSREAGSRGTGEIEMTWGRNVAVGTGVVGTIMFEVGCRPALEAAEGQLCSASTIEGVGRLEVSADEWGRGGGSRASRRHRKDG